MAASILADFDFIRILVGESFPWAYYLEIIFRISSLFVYTIIAAHVMYEKDILECTSSEIIILIAFGAVVGDAMFYEKMPVVHAMVSVTLAVFAARCAAYLAKRSKKIEQFIIGKPIMVIEQGKCIMSAMEKVDLTEDHLMFLLRLQGIKNTGEVEYAFFESNGQLSVMQLYDKVYEGKQTF